MPTYELDTTPGIVSDGSMDAATPLAGIAGGQSFPCLAGRDCMFRFRATCTSLDVFRLLDGDLMRLAVDGKEDGRLGSTPQNIPVPNSLTWGNVSFAGLDGSQEHEYIVSCVGVPSNHDAVAYINSVTINGGDLNHAAPALLPLLVVYGDSIAWGTYPYTPLPFYNGDAGLGFPRQLAIGRRMGLRNLGLPSSTVRQFALPSSDPQGGRAGEARTAEVTGLPVKPTRVIILYGHNDAHGLGPAAGETAAQFQASYTNMLNLLCAGLPTSAIIESWDLLDTTFPAALANLASFRAAQRAAVAAAQAANPTHTIIARATAGVVKTGTADLPDGIHPSYQGNARLVAWETGNLTGQTVRFGFARSPILWWLGGLTRGIHPTFKGPTRAAVRDSRSGTLAGVSGA